MSMKIIFMGTPEFAVHSLEVLKERGDEVMLVISQKDKPKGRGKKLQIFLARDLDSWRIERRPGRTCTS